MVQAGRHASGICRSVFGVRLPDSSSRVRDWRTPIAAHEGHERGVYQWPPSGVKPRKGLSQAPRPLSRAIDASRNLLFYLPGLVLVDAAKKFLQARQI